VLLHAQALRTVLDRGFIHPVPKWLIVAALAGTVLLWFVSVNAAVAMLVACAVAALYFVGAAWLITQGWFFPAAVTMLGGVLALGGRNALDTVAKLRERRRLRGSFSGYVSPAVMAEILAGRVRPELGGASRFVCVMFSDIRGYTTRSEDMSPEEVIRFLNRYFERVVALIHERGGSVMSFMGDGIMAVFGAPNALENPSREAFEAGRKMLEHVAGLNEQLRSEAQTPIDIGIGLHAGEAVIGHVGSSARHDYTAIGDVINVASRLESLTKDAGFRMVISRAVAECLDESESLRPLGPMAIKGHSPVEVYGYDVPT
jgi:class 3 adenylate cyclase